MSEQVSNFDKARELSLSDESDIREEVVEHKGARYRVLPLSPEDQRVARKWASIKGEDGKPVVDDITHGIAMVMLGTFDPDSGRPMYQRSDLLALMRKRGTTLLAKLIKASGRVNAVESIEDAKGNSEGGPTA